MGSGIRDWNACTMGSEFTIIFCVEVSEQVATGHLMVCMACASALREHGVTCFFVLGPYGPAENLLDSEGFPFAVVPNGKTDEVYKKITDVEGCACVVVNYRRPPVSLLDRVRGSSIPLVLMDELGNERVNCDVLINSTVVPEWLNYSFMGQEPSCCFGPEFAVLRAEFAMLHKQPRPTGGDEKRILITMGGVDRTGATLRIVKALSQMSSGIKKTVILGPGFLHMDEFLAQYKSSKDVSLDYAIAVKDFAERIRAADLVISSGGNTLYEMACLGTPGIVLWEDLHEGRQAEVFESSGTVLNIGNGLEAPMDAIHDSVSALINDTARMAAMSRSGLSLVDGLGLSKIVTSILTLVGA